MFVLHRNDAFLADNPVACLISVGRIGTADYGKLYYHNHKSLADALSVCESLDAKNPDTFANFAVVAVYHSGTYSYIAQHPEIRGQWKIRELMPFYREEIEKAVNECLEYAKQDAQNADRVALLAKLES